MKPHVIKLIPTLFQLDLWIGESKDIFNDYGKRYGLKDFDISDNELSTIESAIDSPMKGHKLFVMKLQSFDRATITHELIHLLWHVGKNTGANINYKSQEWQALFVEYVFNEIIKFERNEKQHPKNNAQLVAEKTKSEKT